MKSLKELSLNITESEYRQLPELSYSQLSRFQSVGYNLDKLQEKLFSPSLLFGSMVDTLITGDQEEFDKVYIVTELPSINDNVKATIDFLWNAYKDQYGSISKIPEDVVNSACMESGFWPNSRYTLKARLKAFFQNPVDEYYALKYESEGKLIVSSESYKLVTKAVDALKTSAATEIYFRPDNPFDTDTERLYQLKFTANLNGIGYKCMMDLCVVDHEKKIIIPVDLKTSCSCEEPNFYSNFLQWHYQLQARLYSRILKEVINKDDYFKDFEVLNYRFIIVNRDTCAPLVWEFTNTHEKGTLYYGRYNQIGMPDPEDLGKDLYKFLTTGEPGSLPELKSRNSLDKWLNTI